MKKIHLDLECLDVQSFDTTPEGTEGLGTVRAYGTYFGDESCNASLCPDCNATADPQECPADSNECPSVNVANCQSAWYSDCCGTPGGGIGDPWAPYTLCDVWRASGCFAS